MAGERNPGFQRFFRVDCCNSSVDGEQRAAAGLRRLNGLGFKITALCFCFVPFATGQTQPPAARPLTITLTEAFARARQYGLQVQAADILARFAREDRRQAQAASLPSLNALNDFFYTQGNGTPTGVFVANNGVHVYTEQAVVHEELLALVRRGEIRLAAAGEAVARARVDVAARGLNATVVQNYYSVASAMQRATGAVRNLNEARDFFGITQKQEAGGEVAHSDVIKAQLQVLQRTRELQDAELAVVKAKVALGIFIFPSLQIDYEIADDLAQLPILPPQDEIIAQAQASSPDLRAARLAIGQARLGVTVARYGYLPNLALNFAYGINANQFAARSYGTSEGGLNTTPNLVVPSFNNLG